MRMLENRDDPKPFWRGWDKLCILFSRTEREGKGAGLVVGAIDIGY
jgi:hypothetical protein